MNKEQEKAPLTINLTIHKLVDQVHIVNVPLDADKTLNRLTIIEKYLKNQEIINKRNGVNRREQFYLKECLDYIQEQMSLLSPHKHCNECCCRAQKD